MKTNQDRLLNIDDLKTRTHKSSNRRYIMMQDLRHAGFQFIVYADHDKPYAVFGPYHKSAYDMRLGFSHPLAPNQVSIGQYKRPYSALTKAKKLIDQMIDNYPRLEDEGKAIVNRYKERTQRAFIGRVKLR